MVIFCGCCLSGLESRAWKRLCTSYICVYHEYFGCSTKSKRYWYSTSWVQQNYGLDGFSGGSSSGYNCKKEEWSSTDHPLYWMGMHTFPGLTRPIRSIILDSARPYPLRALRPNTPSFQSNSMLSCTRPIEPNSPLDHPVHDLLAFFTSSSVLNRISTWKLPSHMCPTIVDTSPSLEMPSWSRIPVLGRRIPVHFKYTIEIRSVNWWSKNKETGAPNIWRPNFFTTDAVSRRKEGMGPWNLKKGCLARASAFRTFCVYWWQK